MVNPLSPKQKSALDRAVRHPDLQFVLFSKADGLAWLDAFREAGFLNIDAIPRPKKTDDGSIQISGWPIAEYIVRNSEYLSDEENYQYARDIWKLISDVTQYAKENEFGNYRVWWQFSKIIRMLPLEIIKDNYLEILNYWLSDQYSTGLIGDQLVKWCLELITIKSDLATEVAFSLFNIFFDIEASKREWLDGDEKEATLSFLSYQKRQQLISIASSAGSAYGRRAIQFFTSKLELVLTIDQTDRWSATWRRAIEDHEQNHSNEDADHIILECLRDSVTSYISESDTFETSSVIDCLLVNKFNTVRRIGIYAANVSFKKISENTLDLIINAQYFTETFRHELWEFLNAHYHILSQTQKKSVIEIISSNTAYIRQGDDKNGNKAAFYKSLWFAAIKDSDHLGNYYYQKCVKLTGIVPDHPSFPSFTTSGPVVHQSPVEVDDLLAMSCKPEVMVEYLNNYSYKGFFNEPGLEGLVDVFGEFVSAHIEWVLNNLDSFILLKPHYLHELFDAFLTAWESDKSITWDSEWPKILEYSRNLFTGSSFWLHPEEQTGGAFIGNTHWVVGTFSRLIESGCKNSTHSFDLEISFLAKEVLEAVLSKQKGEEFKDNSDAVSVAINSPRGRCLEAYIYLSRFHVNNCQELDRDKILKSYLETFTNELNRADEESEFEFATLVALFYNDFLHLSKEWATGNISKIFDCQNKMRWLCAIQGYSYAGQFNKEIYDYFKRHDYFISILDSELLRERIGERYLELIIVAYYREIESIDDHQSLISKLINRGNNQELAQLIWIIWTFRNVETFDRARKLVHELFPRIIDTLDLDTRDGRKLASRLSLWAIFIVSITNESKQWLLTISSFADEDYNSNYLLDGLSILSNKHPLDAADIWLKMLHNSGSDYSEKEIKNIFRNLVNEGPNGIGVAKEIAGKYLKFQSSRPREWLGQIINDI